MILWFKKPKKYWSNIFTSPANNLIQNTTECHKEIFTNFTYKNADNFTLKNAVILGSQIWTEKQLLNI